MKKLLNILNSVLYISLGSASTISCNHKENQGIVDLSKLNTYLSNGINMQPNKSLVNDLENSISNLNGVTSKAIKEFYSGIQDKKIIISGTEETAKGDLYNLNYNSTLIADSKIKIAINISEGVKYFKEGIYAINNYISVGKILLTSSNSFELSSSKGNAIEQVRSQLSKLVGGNTAANDIKIDISIFDANNHIVPITDLGKLSKGKTYNIFIMQLNNEYFNVYNGAVDYKVVCS